MVKCPNCGKELTKPKKSWSYGWYNVDSYSCNCGTKFREYTQDGKHVFMLKLKKGRGFVRA